MAVTKNALSVTSALSSQTRTVTPWQVNATSADASGCEEIVAAPASGYALVVTRLVIYIGAAINVTIGAGETQQQLTIDNAAAVDKGAGKVGIPCTGHGLSESGGESITIAGTTNYNGTYTTDATTTANEIVITETYNIETFGGTETIDIPDSYDTVEAVVVGPLGGAAGTYVLDVRERPIQLTAAKSLTFDASGAGTVCIYAEGYTRIS